MSVVPSFCIRDWGPLFIGFSGFYTSFLETKLSNDSSILCTCLCPEDWANMD